MVLSPGTKLGHFDILESIGAGGIGEVYRARDTKLDREVAMPSKFSTRSAPGVTISIRTPGGGGFGSPVG